MDFRPVPVGLLLRTLATMPDDAEIYIAVGDGERVPLLSVGTLRDENAVELGGCSSSHRLSLCVRQQTWEPS